MKLQSLRKRNFSYWLRSLPKDKVVGICGDFGRCPIAEWLISLGQTGVTVREHGISTNQTPHRRIHNWMTAFIRAVDARPTRIEERSITAGECLAILEDV